MRCSAGAPARAARRACMVSASAIGFYGPARRPVARRICASAATAFQSQLCVAREAAANAAPGIGHPRGEPAHRAGPGRRRRHPAASRPAREARAGGGARRRNAVDVVDPHLMIWCASSKSRTRRRDDARRRECRRARNRCGNASFQRALTRAAAPAAMDARSGRAALSFGLGEMADLLIRSQRVAPRRLLEKASTSATRRSTTRWRALTPARS